MLLLDVPLDAAAVAVVVAAAAVVVDVPLSIEKSQSGNWR